MFNCVLVSPKIPQNTGTIGRTCVAIGAKLHIIKPIPFEFDDTKIKRAGLDYWKSLDLTVWDNLDSFLVSNPINDRHFFATTKTDKNYFECKFKKWDYIYFGSEDSGLPIDLMSQNSKNMITIPMRKEYRSLNLSNAVSIVLYDGVRQNFGEFI